MDVKQVIEEDGISLPELLLKVESHQKLSLVERKTAYAYFRWGTGDLKTQAEVCKILNISLTTCTRYDAEIYGEFYEQASDPAHYLRKHIGRIFARHEQWYNDVIVARRECEPGSRTWLEHTRELRRIDSNLTTQLIRVGVIANIKTTPGGQPPFKTPSDLLHMIAEAKAENEKATTDISDNSEEKPSTNVENSETNVSQTPKGE